jgi:hypothetical protein
MNRHVAPTLAITAAVWCLVMGLATLVTLVWFEQTLEIERRVRVDRMFSAGLIDRQAANVFLAEQGAPVRVDPARLSMPESGLHEFIEATVRLESLKMIGWCRTLVVVQSVALAGVVGLLFVTLYKQGRGAAVASGVGS